MKGGSSNTPGVYLYLWLHLKEKRNNKKVKRTKLPLLLPKDIPTCRDAIQDEQAPLVGN